MNKLLLSAAASATCLVLAACGGADNAADTNAAAEANGAEATVDPATTTAADGAAFPQGARIVEEDGVTYRIDPDGTRVQLGPDESRIVIEDGNRFRVDPDGTRVRIDPEGVAVDVDLPDVDVGVNDRGNPDIDVDPRPDGNEGPE